MTKIQNNDEIDTTDRGYYRKIHYLRREFRVKLHARTEIARILDTKKDGATRGLLGRSTYLCKQTGRRAAQVSPRQASQSRF